MRRRLFEMLSALSLLLCIGVFAVWARSNVKDFWLEGSLSRQTYALKVRGGVVSFYRAYPAGGYRRAPVALVEFPMYYPLVIASFATFVLLICTFRTLRADPTRCVNCGYDLRATPDRCPECGSVQRSKD